MRASYGADVGAKPYGPSSLCPWPWSALAISAIRRSPVARARAAPARTCSLVRERAARADDDRRGAHEPERDQRAPVERHRRRAGRGRAERDPDRRQPVGLQGLDAGVRELRIARPLVARLQGRPLRRVALELGRAHDGEVPVDVHAVRRQDDRGLGPRRREPAAELLHPAPRRPLDVLEDRRAVRRDRCEDDHPRDEMRSTISSAKRSPSMSSPTLAFGVAEVLAAAPVDVRASPARPGRAIDLDERVAHVHQRRIDQVRDADGIVHRRAVEVGVPRLVEARVEVHQLRDHRADATR